MFLAVGQQVGIVVAGTGGFGEIVEISELPGVVKSVVVRVVEELEEEGFFEEGTESIGGSKANGEKSFGWDF